MVGGVPHDLRDGEPDHHEPQHGEAERQHHGDDLAERALQRGGHEGTQVAARDGEVLRREHGVRGLTGAGNEQGKEGAHGREDEGHAHDRAGAHGDPAAQEQEHRHGEERDGQHKGPQAEAQVVEAGDRRRHGSGGGHHHGAERHHGDDGEHHAGDVAPRVAVDQGLLGSSLDLHGAALVGPQLARARRPGLAAPLCRRSPFGHARPPSPRG